MYTPPKTWVRVALAGLALAAVIGLYVGVSRSGAGAAGIAADPGAPLPSSTTLAKALPDGPLIDEDRVRVLARQEAEAALARTRTVRKSATPDDSADPAGDATDTAVAGAAPKPPSLPKATASTGAASAASKATGAAVRTTPPATLAPGQPIPY